MTGNDHGTIVAVFDDGGQAEVALDKLWHAGFPHEQIGIVMPGKGVAEAQTETGALEAAGARGAVTGAVTGGTVGAITGALLTGLIPGVGPVLAGGILAGLITGAAAGAAGGAYVGPFIAMGLSEDEARAYERNIHAGRTVLAVRPGERYEEAVELLRRFGGHDIKHLTGEPAGTAV